MVSYGIEAVGNFDLYNANHPDKEKFNLGVSFAFCEKLDAVLSKHHHKKIFYHNKTDVAASHLIDRNLGGTDDYFADNVDIYLIDTHGSHHTINGNIELFYNTKVPDWYGISSVWKLGDKKLKWLMLNVCDTLDKDNVKGLWHIFNGLHEICGSYGAVRTRSDHAEDLGEKLAEYFTTVADAWIDGISDTFIVFDNCPIVIAAEMKETMDIEAGRFAFDWPNSTMDRDRLLFPVPNIPNSDIAWFSIKWKEGYSVRLRSASST